MTRLMANLAIAFLLSQGFDPVLRWLLDLVKAAPLIYARDGIMIVVIVLGFLDIVANRREALAPFAMLAFFLVMVMISITSGLPAAQLGFGLKVWLPVLFGFMLISCDTVREQLDRPVFWRNVWAALVFGIVLDLFVDFPWTGLTISVGDTQVVANREWSTQGFSRVSGFSRTSFDGAIMVQLLAFYLLIKLKSVSARALIWILSGAAIVLTVSKGAVLAYLVATLLLPLVMTNRAELYTHQVARRIVARTGVFLLAVVGCLTPLLAGYLTLKEVEEGTVEYLLFASFGDRVSVTWPFAFNLLDTWQWLLGRGFGGIGAAQQYFELDRYCPGDNFFVYIYVTAGVFGALLYFGLAVGVLQLNLSRPAHRFAFLVLSFIFTYGATLNVIESAVLAMTVGAVAAQLSMRQPAPSYAGYLYQQYGT